MAKNILFHIGDAKTGTSSIQQVLFGKSWSCDTVSVDYTKVVNSFSLANALLEGVKDEKMKAQIKGLRKWLRGSEADLAVVSSEQFGPLSPVALQVFLKNTLPNYADQARVVAYVRPHVSRFISSYLQRTKTGIFFDDIASYAAHKSSFTALSYAPRFMAWRAVFGDRFVLRPMVRSALRDGDVVADFLHTILNGAPFQVTEAKVANESLTVEALSAVIAVQAELKSANIAKPFRHLVGAELNSKIVERRVGPGLKMRITPQICDMISNKFREDARLLDQNFFDSSLMEQALDDAQSETVDVLPSIDLHHHFSAENIAQMQELTRALTNELALSPTNWRHSILQRKGRAQKASANEAKRVKVEEGAAPINALLDRLAERIVDR